MVLPKTTASQWLTVPDRGTRYYPSDGMGGTTTTASSSYLAGAAQAIALGFSIKTAASVNTGNGIAGFDVYTVTVVGESGTQYLALNIHANTPAGSYFEYSPKGVVIPENFGVNLVFLDVAGGSTDGDFQVEFYFQYLQ